MWTFDLREGTTFTNGEAVTAQSFIDSSIVPCSRTRDIAYHAAPIEGFGAVNGSFDEEGEIIPATATELSGLTAPDPQTFHLHAVGAECEFDKRTLQPIFSPVPSVAGAHDNQGSSTQPDRQRALQDEEPWQHDESITLVRNGDYFGQTASLDECSSRSRRSRTSANFQAGDRDQPAFPPN